MPLKVGDRVRTIAGDEGKITVLTDDGVSAYVVVKNADGRGAHATRHRLDSLTKIEDDGAT